MPERISRRGFLGCGAAGLAFAGSDLASRLGIVCQFRPEESAARKVLNAARQAGFRHSQIFFPWDQSNASFLRALPGWLTSEDIRADVLSAYVNCTAPEIAIMSAHAADFDRAVDFAPEIGATRLVAWTGGYNPNLMKSDPRNHMPEASDAICRFLEPRLKRIEGNHLTLALETYITLTCPDAPSLRHLLDRLPAFVTAVLDPPNLTPLVRYGERDTVLREMVRTLNGRIGVVHLKDFRLAKDGQSYELPGPLAGRMNYPMLMGYVKSLSPEIPVVAEHVAPAEFAATRSKLVALLRSL